VDRSRDGLSGYEPWTTEPGWTQTEAKDAGVFSVVAPRGDIVADANARMSIAAVGVVAPSELSCLLDRAKVWRLFWNHMVTVLRSLCNTNIHDFKRHQREGSKSAHMSRSLQIASFSLRDGCVLCLKNASSVSSLSVDIRCRGRGGCFPKMIGEPPTLRFGLTREKKDSEGL
jgi:hypothetical protein